MEQYWMPKELDFENLRFCLDNYSAKRIQIRDCGGVREDGKYHAQGMEKVNANLESRTLDFKKNKSGLYILVDSDEIFHFPLKDYQKGFSLEYERIEPTEDCVGRRVMLSYGTDPYDPNLPEPRRSFLRTILDRHLMEIFFDGRVNLKFHSWWVKPHLKYWIIDKPHNIQETILRQQEEYREEDS
ncbi:hypothetical protein HYX16_02405 [Candidatus Woesearchaeota archaeon]|nr:hypothetical protein [Candidatus Woesearchaeota archaeon]